MLRNTPSVLKNKNRQKALIRLALIALGGAIFFSWLLYSSATASGGIGALQAQVFVNGTSAQGIPYTLDGEGMIAGTTGEDGMIVARNIAQGQWVIMVGCASVTVTVGEVAAQSPAQVDATCNYFIFMPEVLR